MLVSNYHFASIFTNSSSNQLKSVIIPWKCPEVALPVTSESVKWDVRKFRYNYHKEFSILLLNSFRGTIQILPWNKINANYVYPWEFHDLVQLLGQAAIPGAEPPKRHVFLAVLGALQDLVVPQVSVVPPQLILAIHVHILERVYWY